MTIHLGRFATAIDAYFGVSERGSSLQIELRGGAATFASLSYIFALTPVMFAQIGAAPGPILLMTVLISCLVTITSGFWSRLPFVLAPGLEMSLYVVLVVVPVLRFTLQEALSCVIASGVAVSFLAIPRVKHLLIDKIPHHFSCAVAIVMSSFLLVEAAGLSGVIRYDQGCIHFVGTPGYALAWGAAGCLVVFACEAIGIRFSVLLSVLVVAILTRAHGGAPLVAGNAVFGSWRDFSNVDYLMRRPFETLGVSFSLFVLSCYGSLSKLINLTEGTSIRNSHGEIPGVRKMLLIEGIASIISGLGGITNSTAFVESGIGIDSGARTGLAAIMAGTMMLIALVLEPFIQFIPVTAAVGAFLYVGVLFFPRRVSLARFSALEWVTTGIMVVLVVWNLSFGLAFAVGVIGFIISRILTERSRDIRQKASSGQTT